jgi:hypothetical protein
MNRYVVRLAVLMAIYLISLFAAVTAFKTYSFLGVFGWILAVLPALPIIGIFWAAMRLLIEEPDEFIKLLLVRQFLVATGFCLTVMTIWEFLQNFELVAPGNHGFGAAMFWFMGLGVGALYNKFTLGTSGS